MYLLGYYSNKDVGEDEGQMYEKCADVHGLIYSGLVKKTKNWIHKIIIAAAKMGSLPH